MLLASRMSLLQDFPPPRAPDAHFLTGGLLFYMMEAYALVMREQDVTTHVDTFGPFGCPTRGKIFACLRFHVRLN